MEVNESHSPVFNRPFVCITDGAEETGDYLFVNIEVRQAIALRDALLAKYPVERWEPLSEEYTDVWRCQVKLIDNYLRIYNEVTGGWEDVELPPTIRLCRLVEGA